MATAGEIITGSTDSPAADGISRGVVVAAVQGVAAFVALQLGISVEGMAALSPVVPLLGLMLYGLWDRFGRGKVLDRAENPAP